MKYLYILLLSVFLFPESSHSQTPEEPFYLLCKTKIHSFQLKVDEEKTSVSQWDQDFNQWNRDISCFPDYNCSSISDHRIVYGPNLDDYLTIDRNTGNFTYKIAAYPKRFINGKLRTDYKARPQFTTHKGSCKIDENHPDSRSKKF